MELGEIDEVASRRQEDRMAAIERQLTKAINAQAELSRENTALKEDNKALRKSHDALKKLVEHCVREGLIASKANACLDNISSEMVSSPDHRPKDSRSDSAFPSGGSVKNGSALEDTDASTVQKLTTSQEKLTKNILAMEKAAADFKKSAENRLLTFQEQTERDIRGIKKAINHIIDGVDSTRRATAHAWLKDGMILKNVREEVASLWGQVSRLEVMTVVPDKAQVNNQRDRIAHSNTSDYYWASLIMNICIAEPTALNRDKLRCIQQDLQRVRDDKPNSIAGAQNKPSSCGFAFLSMALNRVIDSIEGAQLLKRTKYTTPPPATLPKAIEAPKGKKSVVSKENGFVRMADARDIPCGPRLDRGFDDMASEDRRWASNRRSFSDAELLGRGYRDGHLEVNRQNAARFDRSTTSVKRGLDDSMYLDERRYKRR